MRLFSLWLLLGALALAPVSLLAKDYFTVPMYLAPVETQELSQLAGHLKQRAKDFEARTQLGYDWVFPSLSAKTTAAFFRLSQEGHFQNPGLIRAEIAQFHELYARNANLWMRGLPCESHWEKTAKLSRRLASLDLTDEADRNSAAVVQALMAMYAHIVVDLPKALLVLAYRDPGAQDLGVMKADFFKAQTVFDPIVEEIIREGKISPKFLAKIWDWVPRWLRKVIVGESLPTGVGVFMRSSRRFAWYRFRWNYRFRRHRKEIEAMPPGESLAWLDLPDSEIRSEPSHRALPVDGEDPEALERAFEAFLLGRELPPLPEETSVP